MSLLVPASEDELSDTGGSRLYVLPWECGLGGDLARTLETKRHRRFFVCLFVCLVVRWRAPRSAGGPWWSNGWSELKNVDRLAFIPRLYPSKSVCRWKNVPSCSPTECHPPWQRDVALHMVSLWVLVIAFEREGNLGAAWVPTLVAGCRWAPHFANKIISPASYPPPSCFAFGFNLSTVRLC